MAYGLRHYASNERYRLQDELGGGEFGVVFKATDRYHYRDVAIKVVIPNRSNPSFLSSLQGLKDAAKEAETLSKLRNPYVIGFIDYYEFPFRRGHGAAIVTPYYSGGSLGNYLLEHRTSYKLRLWWCCQLSLGIRFIHGQGVAHRDLKPDNILIDGHGALKIADVGLAKAVWDINEGIYEGRYISFHAYMRTVCGTRPFMAPEVFDGHYSFKCDIFSLGLVFACIIEARKQMFATYRSWHSLGQLYYNIPSSRASSACSLMTLQYASPDETHLINKMCDHDYHYRCSIGYVVEDLERRWLKYNDEVLRRKMIERQTVKEYQW